MIEKTIFNKDVQSKDNYKEAKEINTKAKVIQKEIGNTKYTVNIFCKKEGKDLKDKMKSIIKEEITKINEK